MTRPSEGVRILIAASGSGGHLIPALHIARAFKDKHANFNIEFVGSGRPLEEKLIEGQGYKRHVISISGIKRGGVSGLLLFLLRLPSATLATWRLLSEFRPHLIVGVGGYVSFLPVLLGALRAIPTWIHEAEMKPGLANYVLSLFATGVSITFSETRMLRASRVHLTGHPVRPSLKVVRERKSYAEKPSRILLLGGSQGAEGIDRVVLELLGFFRLNSFQIWHQCRPENLQRLKKEYEQANISAKVVEFISEIEEGYLWADIIVSRAGASAVMEIGVVNIPAIFVPYPFAQGDHQTANANLLVKQGKAFLVSEGDAFASRLKETLQKLCDPAMYRSVWQKDYEERGAGAANAIVEGCLGLLNKVEVGRG